MAAMIMDMIEYDSYILISAANDIKGSQGENNYDSPREESCLVRGSVYDL
jgi:hypothetical protein